MGRAKLRMNLISNEKARRTTFEKRKKGLEKKASELSTLCGVKIGMIMYDPSSDEPAIWPRNRDEVSFLIDCYKSKPGHDHRRNRTNYDLPMFFKDQTEKVEEEFERVNKKMKEVKYPKWDESFDRLSQEQLKEFSDVLSTKIDAVRERINAIKESQKFQFMESGFLNDPSIQENEILMPSSSNMSSEAQDMIPWVQTLACSDAPKQGNWTMPMKVENSQIDSVLSFNENFCNNEKFPVQNFDVTNAEPLMYDNALLGDATSVNSQISSPFSFDDSLIKYENFPLQSFGTMENVCMANVEPLMYDNALFGDMMNVNSQIRNPFTFNENFSYYENLPLQNFDDSLIKYENFPLQSFGTMENVCMANVEPLMYDNALFGDMMNLNSQIRSPFTFNEDFSYYENLPLQNFGTMDNVHMANAEPLMFDNTLFGDVMNISGEPLMYDYAQNLIPESQNWHGMLSNIAEESSNSGMSTNEERYMGYGFQQ